MNVSFGDLDAVLNAPKRLHIMGILGAANKVDFSFLRSTLELRDSDLSKQMSALEAAGYVKVDKSRPGPNSSTWYSITRPGRSALDRHVAVLTALAQGAGVEGA